jgi:hypothetical protein
MKVNLIKTKSNVNPDWDSYSYILKDIYTEYPEIAKYYGFGEKSKLKVVDSVTYVDNIKCLAVGVESVVFEDPGDSNLVCKFTNSTTIAQISMRLVNNPQKNMVKVLSVCSLPKAEAFWIVTERLYDSKKKYKKEYFKPYFSELYSLAYLRDTGDLPKDAYKYKNVSIQPWAKRHASNTLKSWKILGVDCDSDYMDMDWDHNIMWSKSGVPTLFDFGVGYDTYGKIIKIPVYDP